MSYSELHALAQREASHRADDPHARARADHAVVAHRAREGRLRRTSRRLLGRGARPAHILEGETAPRARSRDRPDTASA